jgi:hypothetical protein
VLKSSNWQFNKLKYNKRLENGKFTHETEPGSKIMITKAHETNAKSQSKEFAAALELKTNNNFCENY